MKLCYLKRNLYKFCFLKEKICMENVSVFSIRKSSRYIKFITLRICFCFDFIQQIASSMNMNKRDACCFYMYFFQSYNFFISKNNIYFGKKKCNFKSNKIMHIFLSEERIRKINQNIRLIYNEATSVFLYLKKIVSQI